MKRKNYLRFAAVIDHFWIIFFLQKKWQGIVQLQSG